MVCQFGEVGACHGDNHIIRVGQDLYRRLSWSQLYTGRALLSPCHDDLPWGLQVRYLSPVPWAS